MKQLTPQEITSLRRLQAKARNFLTESESLLQKLGIGEEVESPSPTPSKSQKTKALINDLFTSGRRVRKKDIQSL